MTRWCWDLARRSRSRRTMLLLALAGSSSVWLPSNSLWADDGFHPVVIPANYSLSWATQTAADGSYAMIVEDEEDAQTRKATDRDSAASGDKDVDADERSEDEKRRQRLRDLLGDDDVDLLPKRRGNGDSKMNDRDSKSPPDTGRDARSKAKRAGGKDDLFSEPFIEERLPDVADGRFILPALRAVSIDEAPIGNGRIPETVSAGDELILVALPEDTYARTALVNEAAWPALIRPWAAPNTFSHPLYFEDRMLERHGHERWGCMQPIASGVRFFTTLPMLPYLATVQEPCDIVYSKGYYRAGSPVPKFYQRPPLEKRAVIVESAAVAGAFIALP